MRPSLLSKTTPLTAPSSMIGMRGPRVVDELDLALEHDLLAEQLEPLGVDRRRPGDDAVVGGGAVRPVRRLGRVLRAPVGARRAGDRVGRQAVEQFFGEAADHRHALPVGHAVDPDHEAAGRQPAEVVVALEQGDVGALLRGRRGRRRARGPATDHQHLGAVVDLDRAAGLLPGAQVGPGPLRALRSKMSELRMRSSLRTTVFMDRAFEAVGRILVYTSVLSSRVCEIVRCYP